jgi:hypothetical protein
MKQKSVCLFALAAVLLAAVSALTGCPGPGPGGKQDETQKFAPVDPAKEKIFSEVWAALGCPNVHSYKGWDIGENGGLNSWLRFYASDTPSDKTACINYWNGLPNDGTYYDDSESFGPQDAGERFDSADVSFNLQYHRGDGVEPPRFLLELNWYNTETKTTWVEGIQAVPSKVLELCQGMLSAVGKTAPVPVDLEDGKDFVHTPRDTENEKKFAEVWAAFGCPDVHSWTDNNGTTWNSGFRFYESNDLDDKTDGEAYWNTLPADGSYYSHDLGILERHEVWDWDMVYEMQFHRGKRDGEDATWFQIEINYTPPGDTTKRIGIEAVPGKILEICQEMFSRAQAN